MAGFDFPSKDTPCIDYFWRLVMTAVRPTLVASLNFLQSFERRDGSEDMA